MNEERITLYNTPRSPTESLKKMLDKDPTLNGAIDTMQKSTTGWNNVRRHVDTMSAVILLRIMDLLRLIFVEDVKRCKVCKGAKAVGNEDLLFQDIEVNTGTT